MLKCDEHGLSSIMKLKCDDLCYSSWLCRLWYGSI
jgi:hypothetical protein